MPSSQGMPCTAAARVPDSSDYCPGVLLHTCGDLGQPYTDPITPRANRATSKRNGTAARAWRGEASHGATWRDAFSCKVPSIKAEGRAPHACMGRAHRGVLHVWVASCLPCCHTRRPECRGLLIPPVPCRNARDDTIPGRAGSTHIRTCACGAVRRHECRQSTS